MVGSSFLREQHVGEQALVLMIVDLRCIGVCRILNL